MGILTDGMIQLARDMGDLEIEPWDETQLNPASYDLTLGDEVATYNVWNEPNSSYIIDTKQEAHITTRKITDYGLVISPGMGYLMHTRERIWTNSFVPIVDGKSSIGRLFVQVHATAGYGDPGFDGQYTLEVMTKHPVRLYAGMRIAQIRFHSLFGRLIKGYAGNYTGNAALGAVPSRSFKQFQKGK